MKRSEAVGYRKMIEASAVKLTDEEAFYSAELFPPYAVGVEYAVGDRIKSDGVLYKVAQAHTSQADWMPSHTPALYVVIPDPAIEYPEWKQPAGAHDAYALGDKVSHNGKKWVSGINANVYEPGVYGWNEA